MSELFRNPAGWAEWLVRRRVDRRTNIRLAALLAAVLLHGLVFWWGVNSARFANPSPEKLQAIRVFLQPMELPELAAPARTRCAAPAPAAKARAMPLAATPLPSVAPPPPTSLPTPAASPVPAPAPVAAAPEAPCPVAMSLAPLPVAAVAPAVSSRPAAGEGGMPGAIGPAVPGNTTGTLSGPDQGSGSGVATGSPAPASGGGPGGSGLELYKRRLFAHIDAHKIYPASARRRQLEGQVRVVFTVAPGGGLGNLQVSEGHPQLEEAARLTVLSALPLPLPAAGVELPFTFSFRMDFRLR